ncbi:MAG: hypothetical protein AB7T31_16105 [Gemmatimonadales bacterium]
MEAARRVLVLGAVLGSAACASGGGGSGGGGGGAGNAITRDMIDNPSNQNAYTIVQRFRPRWLSPRTQGTIANPEPSFPQVYVDEVRFGPIDTLYRIEGTQIERIEFMSSLDATTRYGVGHDGGAIMVWTINSRPR